MACWGFHALESDEGLLLLDRIGEKLAAGKQSLKLADIIALLRSEKLLDPEGAANTEDYDLAVLALSEFYDRMQGEKDLSALKNSRHALAGLEALEEVSADPESLAFLHRRLQEIQDDIDSCERSYAAFWLEAADYYDWVSYVDRLVEAIGRDKVACSAANA